MKKWVKSILVGTAPGCGTAAGEAVDGPSRPGLDDDVGRGSTDLPRRSGEYARVVVI